MVMVPLHQPSRALQQAVQNCLAEVVQTPQLLLATLQRPDQITFSTK